MTFVSVLAEIREDIATGRFKGMVFVDGITLLLQSAVTDEVKCIEIVDVLKQVETGAICLKYKVRETSV